jgi:hypothetical protein
VKQEYLNPAFCTSGSKFGVESENVQFGIQNFKGELKKRYRHDLPPNRTGLRATCLAVYISGSELQSAGSRVWVCWLKFTEPEYLNQNI